MKTFNKYVFRTGKDFFHHSWMNKHPWTYQTSEVVQCGSLIKMREEPEVGAGLVQGIFTNQVHDNEGNFISIYIYHSQRDTYKPQSINGFNHLTKMPWVLAAFLLNKHFQDSSFVYSSLINGRKQGREFNRWLISIFFVVSLVLGVHPSEL